jgi:hypothetical protein
VEYIHIGLLLGYVMDILLDTVTKNPDLDAETKAAVLKAFNKVIWIQNDRKHARRSTLWLVADMEG